MKLANMMPELAISTLFFRPDVFTRLIGQAAQGALQREGRQQFSDAYEMH
jgi:hypothetical protein